MPRNTSDKRLLRCFGPPFGRRTPTTFLISTNIKVLKWTIREEKIGPILNWIYHKNPKGDTLIKQTRDLLPSIGHLRLLLVEITPILFKILHILEVSEKLKGSDDKLNKVYGTETKNGYFGGPFSKNHILDIENIATIQSTNESYKNEMAEASLGNNESKTKSSDGRAQIGLGQIQIFPLSFVESYILRPGK